MMQKGYSQFISLNMYVRLCVHYIGNAALLGPSIDKTDTPRLAQQFIEMFHFEEFVA